jgi:hypothetical protein
LGGRLSVANREAYVDEQRQREGGSQHPARAECEPCRAPPAALCPDGRDTAAAGRVLAATGGKPFRLCPALVGLAELTLLSMDAGPQVKHGSRGRAAFLGRPVG